MKACFSAHFVVEHHRLHAAGIDSTRAQNCVFSGIGRGQWRVQNGRPLRRGNAKCAADAAHKRRFHCADSQHSLFRRAAADRVAGTCCLAGIIEFIKKGFKHLAAIAREFDFHAVDLRRCFPGNGLRGSDFPIIHAGRCVDLGRAKLAQLPIDADALGVDVAGSIALVLPGDDGATETIGGNRRIHLRATRGADVHAGRVPHESSGRIYGLSQNVCLTVAGVLPSTKQIAGGAAGDGGVQLGADTVGKRNIRRPGIAVVSNSLRVQLGVGGGDIFPDKVSAAALVGCHFKIDFPAHRHRQIGNDKRPDLLTGCVDPRYADFVVFGACDRLDPRDDGPLAPVRHDDRVGGERQRFTQRLLALIPLGSGCI